MPFELRRYRDVYGRIPLSEWLSELSSIVAGRVLAYIDRMKSGNFGHSRPVGEGVWELKINFGPGYRVYYLHDGRLTVVLLCGGDKASQQEDIRLAREYASDYRSRR